MMEPQTVERLLKRRPGYEVVYLLQTSDRRRKELADYTDADGGVLQRWLDRAEAEGLISKKKYVDETGEVRAEFSLEVNPTELAAKPKKLQRIIDARGGSGARTANSGFADAATIHMWRDDYSFEDVW